MICKFLKCFCSFVITVNIPLIIIIACSIGIICRINSLSGRYRKRKIVGFRFVIILYTRMIYTVNKYNMSCRITVLIVRNGYFASI